MIVTKVTIVFSFLFFIHTYGQLNSKSNGTYKSRIENVTSISGQFAYMKNISIDSSVVEGASDFTDYPLLIQFILPELRHISYGGHLQSLNANDIIFTLPDSTMVLSHEIENYNPSTGSLTCWVKLPTLYTYDITRIKMYYGNLCSFPASTGQIWNDSYEMVLHMNQNPAFTSSINDYSGNGHSGTTIGTMLGSNLIGGIAGNGLSFDEVNDAVVISDFDYANTQSFSLSFWFKITDNVGTSYQYMYSHGNYGTFNSLNTYFGEESLAITADQNMLKSVFQDSNDATNPDALNGGTTLVDGNWHYYVFSVSDLGNPKVFIDGALIANLSFQGGQTYNPTTDIYLGTRADLNTTRYFGGMLDEVRIYNNSISGSYIRTTYNNFSNPSSFATIGSEILSSSPCIPLNNSSLSASGSINPISGVTINWNSGQETGVFSYDLQRSSNAIDWEYIVNISGVGSNLTDSIFVAYDQKPIQGTTYYRIKQYYPNGTIVYSQVITINFKGIEIITSYPNPTKDELNLIINSSEATEVRIILYNILGNVCFSEIYFQPKGFFKYSRNCDFLPDGSYVLKVQTTDGKYYDQKSIKFN